MNKTETALYKHLQNEGNIVDKPIHTRFNRTDFFNLFDFIAVDPSGFIRFIQVSALRLKSRKKGYEERFMSFPSSQHYTKEFWHYNSKKAYYTVTVYHGDNIKKALYTSKFVAM